MVEVSPDLVDRIPSALHIAKPEVIEFEYDGEIVDSFYLSKEFSSEHGVLGGSIVPLPEDYPLWVMLLRPVCSHCLNSAME